MKKHLFGMALTVSVMLCAGVAAGQYTAINDIQVYDALGAPASPFNGQTVTVRGVVYVTAGTYNSGTHYIQGTTGGIQFFLNSPTFPELADVEITGTVSSFSGEIQISSPTVTQLGTAPSLAPIELELSTILGNYETVGNFVRTTGIVKGKYANLFSMYPLGGAPTDTIPVYIDSDTGIDINVVAVGDTVQVDSPVVNFNTLIELKPRKQADIVVGPGGDTAPVIDAIDLVDWCPLANEAIQVDAQITDDGVIAAATLHYRDNDTDGTNPGMWMTVAMTPQGGNTYRGVIPAPHASDVVEFYVEATDDGANTVTNPSGAPASYRTTAVGITPIYTMQYVHPDSASQTTPYFGKFLNIRGIITASPGQAGAVSRMVVQEQNPNPATGTYAFGGVLIYAGTGLDPANWFQGDLVEIGGSGGEYFGLTEMEPHNRGAIYLIDFGLDLPPASRVATRVLRDDVTNLGEAWESVWVKTFTAAVIDTNGFGAFGEYVINDKANRPDSLLVAPEADLIYVPNPGDILTIEGYMDYAFGSFRIVPISDEFIVQSDATSVDLPTVEVAGGFQSLAPNPFNPATKIRFVVNRENLVQLNVYNIRGELVRQLVKDRLPANTYTLEFDGKDDTGRNLASGTYFARLRIGSEVMQVRKMSLVK